MNEEWRQDANCAGTDTETFFPEKGESSAYAKRICGRCDVRAECLQWALDTRQAFGVWGGLSTRQREELWERGKPRALPTRCMKGHDLRDPAVAGVKPDGTRWCRRCGAERKRNAGRAA